MQQGAISSGPQGTGAEAGRRVGLMVTCLIDLMRPSAGLAAARLLDAAGCSVTVPAEQTCCGQPGYNSGDRDSARALAKRVIAAFEGLDYVVVPSGSCAGMLRVHYPALLEEEAAWQGRARDLAARTWELTAFLAEICDVRIASDFAETVTYHDGCAGLRELGLKDQPRRLLGRCGGLTLTEMAETERCCGFGGTFCIKYDAISAEMGRRKLDRAEATRAGLVVAGELGCLLHLAGLAAAEGRGLAFRHIAEVLADMTEIPPMGRESR